MASVNVSNISLVNYNQEQYQSISGFNVSITALLPGSCR